MKCLRCFKALAIRMGGSLYEEQKKSKHDCIYRDEKVLFDGFQRA